jgi:RimJ/RimL family protein N-acetyltransferase
MVGMASAWPLFDLRLATPRLELRPPRDDDFPGLMDAIDAGIHDPDVMPFSQAWTDADPEIRRLRAMQHWWSTRAGWKVGDWHLPFAVFLEGNPIGIQEVFARRFPVLREVATGSWLSRPYQGQGFGKEMRSAVLQFAFEGLGALIARSGAFVDNPASAGVSRALGYRENGRRREAPRGEVKEMVDYEITLEEWLSRRDSIPRTEIAGLEGARRMFTLAGLA